MAGGWLWQCQWIAVGWWYSVTWRYWSPQNWHGFTTQCSWLWYHLCVKANLGWVETLQYEGRTFALLGRFPPDKSPAVNRQLGHLLPGTYSPCQKPLYTLCAAIFYSDCKAWGLEHTHITYNIDQYKQYKAKQWKQMGSYTDYSKTCT